MSKKADFHEWMSGRYHWGDKAPKEGFYDRYTPFQLDVIEIGFLQGVNGVPLSHHKNLSEKENYLLSWAHWVGALLKSREVQETQTKEEE